MPRLSFALAVLATAALGACSMNPKPTDSAPVASEAPPSTLPAKPPMPAGACDAAKARWVVGRPGDAALLEKARSDAGAKIARLLTPGQMVTMEYSAERLNLRVNDQGVVESVNCG
jgi:Peptidase inhibitor I78 family